MWCDLRLCLNGTGREYAGVGGCIDSCRAGTIVNGKIKPETEDENRTFQNYWKNIASVAPGM